MPFTRLTTISTGSSGTLRLDARTGGNIIARSTLDGEWITNFDANGVRTTIVGFAPGGTGQTLRLGDIEALTSGGFVVDGTIFSGQGRGTNVQVYDAQGTAVTAILTPTDEQTGNALNGLNYVISATANGGYALTWSEDSRSGTQLTASNGFTASEGQDARIRYFDANGIALAPSDLASTAQAPIVDNPGVLLSRLAFNQAIYDSETLIGGGVAYVYLDTRPFTGVGGFGQDFELTLQVASGSGTPGTPIKVDLGVIGDGNTTFLNFLDGANGANVVALATGGIAVIWQENAYTRTGPSSFVGDGINTLIRFFDANGNAQSDPFVILHRTVPLAQSNTYVWGESLPDGRVVIAWHEAGFTPPFNNRIDAFAATVGISGVVTDVQRLNAAPANSGEFFIVQDVAVASDGTVNIAFGTQFGPNTQIARFATTAEAQGIVYNAPAESTTYSGTAGDDLITGGVGNDVLIGLAGNDRIDGGAGNDVAAGGAGDDVIIGGTGGNELYGNTGNDVFVVTTLGDTIVELAGEGIDTVRTTLAAYTLGAQIENLEFDDSLAHIGFGNAADNVITGSTAFDQFAGLGGNDTLVGGSGAANLLVGGTGDDIYVTVVAGDTIVETAGEGNDTIETTLTNYVLSANLENLTFTDGSAHNGLGNAFANILTSGVALANTLVGLSGDDIYVVRAAGTSVVEAAGEGTDTVRTTLATYTLETNVENLAYTGTGTFGGVGNGADNIITGGALADTLVGLGGNDTLNGGGGLDYLLGGAGADRFMVSNLTSGPDRILDFTSGEDRIVFDNAIAHTATVELVSGPGSLAATTANSTFLYNSTSGELFYDADGTGAGAAVLVELLNTGLTLNVSDFVFA